MRVMLTADSECGDCGGTGREDCLVVCHCVASLPITTGRDGTLRLVPPKALPKVTIQRLHVRGGRKATEKDVGREVFTDCEFSQPRIYLTPGMVRRAAGQTAWAIEMLAGEAPDLGDGS